MVYFYDISVAPRWQRTGKASLGLAKKLKFLNKNVNKLNAHLRKAAHTFLFFVFILLLIIALKSLEKKIIYGIVIAFFWAWADERTKPFIKGRHFSWFDVGLNICGVVLGLAASLLII